jgi:basic membrane protein A
MKKILAVFLTVMMLFALAGCGSSTPPANTGAKTETPAATAAKVKIALVLPATVDDMAWGQSMVEGLNAVKKSMGDDKVEVAISEKLGNAVDAGAAIRQYASQGYDIIFAHGSQFQSVLGEIAKDFPKTTFAYGTGFTTADNIFAYDPQAQEGGYLLGMLAGLMSKSGIVGIVGPVESGDAVKYNYGVQQGVAKAKSTVQVRTAYTGSFNDIVGAGNLAKTHISAGADFVTGSSQQAVGAVSAVKESKDVFWLSTDMDQSSLAPDHVLAAQVYHWEKVVNKIIELRKAGTLGGQKLTLSLADGTIELKYNSALESKIPADVKATIDQAKQDIISGKLVVELPKK